jgi:hypothetical protein
MKEKELEKLLLMRDRSTRQFFVMLCDGGKGDMQPYYGLCGHSRDKWTGLCIEIRTHDILPTQTSAPGFHEQKQLAKSQAKGNCTLIPFPCLIEAESKSQDIATLK